MKHTNCGVTLDQIYPSSDGGEVEHSSVYTDMKFFLYDIFCHIFADQNVSVHANLFWYPVRGYPHNRQAPLLMVILDCQPNNKRKSYRQWLEGNAPATVVIELLSESNDADEMKKRRSWYRKYGVSEYYEIAEGTNTVTVWLLQNGKFVKQKQITSFTSPSTGVKFDWSGVGLVVSAPDGTPFHNGHQIRYMLKEAFRQQQEAEVEKQKAEAEKQKAEAHVAELQRQLDELRKNQDP